ncbi:MAG TPA: dienelactone hydrolase family protein [Vicinamibacterales bacterium]|jgi:carboxymethylenebutenolidase
MRIRLTIATLVAAAATLVVVMSHTRATVVVEAAAPAGEHAAHVMTAAEHVAHLAAAGNIHAAHAIEEMKWAAMQAAPANAALPADDMGAVARLASSPRKGEYVKIDINGTPVNTWVVRPSGNGRAPVVVVIQEVFGLSDWIRGVADQLAAEGFIAVAPDLLSGKGPNSGDSSSFGGQQELVKATLSLQAPEIVARIKGAREWALKLPRANGKSGVVGFCFGGNQSFAMAVAEPSLNAAVVYYGTAPTDAPAAGGGGRGAGGGGAAAFVPSASLANVKAPVLGLYGGMMQDARIGNTIAATEMKMKELGKVYEPHIFDGAAHGFLRAQSGNEGANLRATQQAWPLTVGWLKKYTS